MKTRLMLAATSAVILAGLPSIQAQPLTYTFDTDVEGFQNLAWTAGPVGWTGGAALQAQPTVGGWTLGGSFNFGKEFSWTPGGGVAEQQPAMQALSASGNGRLSFDLILDGTSFVPAVGTWYNINIAGNSGGANPWTQIQKITGDGWHNADDPTLLVSHHDFSFAQLGWQDPEDATGWFQLYFGANSDADKPVKFYIDNVTAYAVPEPSAAALAGLGLLGAALLRRRLS